MIDENHPNFDPHMLPVAEQIKYFERKKEKEKERNAQLKAEADKRLNRPRTVTIKNK